jgi:hypothetical protein
MQYWSKTMTQESPGRTRLARLVLLLVFLYLAGTLIAALHGYTIDPSRQELIKAPMNSPDSCAEKCGAFAK